jgi:uncharacterized membrane protein
MDVLTFFALIAMLVMTAVMLGRLNTLDAALRALDDKLGDLTRRGIPAPAARTAGAPAEPLEPAPEPAPEPQPVLREAQVEPVVTQPVTPEPEPAVEDIPAPQPALTPEERAEAFAEEPPAPPEIPAPPRDYGDFERRFGTQWVVWIGGLALALGAIFLVRYSIEAGLFTPKLRIIFGAIFALFLVGLGELARRREVTSGIGQIKGADIPSILTAAGTTAAYADVWAAYALYDFLSPGVAFVLLGIVALATLAAALVHGQGLAGLGLVGAYVTPLLVSTAQPNYWALYIYLAVVTAAAYALARIRLWRWLAITAAVFSLLWMLVGIAIPNAIGAHAFHAIAGFALAAAFIVAGLLYGPPAERGRFDMVSSWILASPGEAKRQRPQSRQPRS